MEILLIVIGRTKKKGEEEKNLSRAKRHKRVIVVRQKLAKRRFDLPVTPEGSLIPNYFVGTGRLRRSI